ncbi:MAG: hypothetical protein HC904_14925 [Blastochloris sp.]|nr:hypothetical protein [Blastochloris sp.]
MKESTASEAECWQALVEGRIDRSFGVVAWKLREQEADTSMIAFHIPTQGTLIQFDHFMIPSDSPYVTAVEELVKGILSEKGREQLWRREGYFSVMSKVGRELGLGQKSGQDLGFPGTNWLDRSEFPTLSLGALFNEPPESSEQEPLPVPPVGTGP